MDKLFTYESSTEMIKRLLIIEDEMREDSYPNCSMDIRTTSRAALGYIMLVYDYVANHFKEEECTVFTLMKELYRIALTGEYMYIQEFDDIGYKNDAFERMQGETGFNELLYAVRLLRYYYIVMEKKHHSKSNWMKIEELYKKVSNLGFLKKPVKKEREATHKLTEDEFIPALRSHMDRNMVGQDLLKKKLCSVIYQFKYHNERSVVLMVGKSGTGKNHMITTIKTFPELGCKVVTYDCSQLTPNGFCGDDVSGIFKKIRKIQQNSILNQFDVGRQNEKVIVYLDEIDKIICPHHDSYGENVHGFVQQALLSALAGTEVIEGVKTANLLFILGGAFQKLENFGKTKKNQIGFNPWKDCKIDYTESLRDQIISMGGEVEFVSRIEDIIKMQPLSRDDLKTILMDKHIGAYTKKRKLYQASGLKLEIEDDTVDAIVDLIENDPAAARSVKNVLNTFAGSEYFYEMKVGGFATMKIHKGMLNGEAPIFLKEGES